MWLAVEVDEVEVADMLVALNRLDRNVADDPRRLAAALETFIADLTLAWLEECHA
jgi:hypothetical protein